MTKNCENYNNGMCMVSPLGKECTADSKYNCETHYFDTILGNANEKLTELENLRNGIAELRELMPVQWLDLQGSYALGAVVSDPEEALAYTTQYTKDLKAGLKYAFDTMQFYKGVATDSYELDIALDTINKLIQVL